ncbi:hypothetical protein [Neptuniibacter sp. QD37_11]|uniref:hypothetical protein n=1 Tax=Neptuniibacter sp. QD37_11 TaxID=3398209 RepID=UPI0039F4478C
MAKQVVIATQIVQKWWSEDKTVDVSRYTDMLQETGSEQARLMIENGMREGELNDNIAHYVDDPEDGVDFRGWFTVQQFSQDAQPEEGALDDGEALEKLDQVICSDWERESAALRQLVNKMADMLPEGTLANIITEQFEDELEEADNL